MNITYKSKRLEKVCTNFSEAVKQYGDTNAQKIHQRIGEIYASPDVEYMINNRIGRCHSLTGDRKGQYAMDLVNPFRLVFTVNGTEIQIANVIEITNYH